MPCGAASFGGSRYAGSRTASSTTSPSPKSASLQFERTCCPGRPGHAADPAALRSGAGRSGNFEDTLAELQAEARTRASAEAIARLAAFEQAVMATFTDMNQVFAAFPGWRLSNDARDSIDAFLSRFDAIFTLNQDLLLELHYRNELVGGRRRWAGPGYPGMAPPPNWQAAQPAERIALPWQPAGEVRLADNLQPIFKLHGSANWRDPAGNHLMVMGGAKLQAIDRHPLLRRYLELFAQQLNAGDTKVMVIGYGFQDDHINDLLVQAGTQHGMQIHLVNPAGLDVLRRYPAQAIQGPNPLNDIPLIGVTMRSLREAFSGDKLSQRSLLRFFE